MTILNPSNETRVHENNWKEKPRAFIILGLEGAGNYMLQNALVEAGCGKNDRLDKEPPDYEALEQFDGDIVIRKSFPHAEHWPIWERLLKRCLLYGYDVFIIWIIRETNARTQSVIRRDPQRDVSDLLLYQTSFFQELSRIKNYSVDYEIITYSAFVHSEGFRRWLFEERLQLPYPEDFEVLTDRNDQYYE